MKHPQMKQKNDTSADRGQVGIGTLIVFIALVLVAAIAAGVLINTAGFLQSQAEATGEESTDQVSDRIQVQSATGVVANTEIETVNLLVSLAPGADPVDLTAVTVQIENGEIVQLTDGDQTNSGEFGSNDLSGASIDTLGGGNDEANIVLDLTTDASPIQEGQSLTVTITTASGGTTQVELQAPRTILTNDNGRAVRL
jgi:flagellin FlaB